MAQEIKIQLENLPKRQREVIYLKFFEGLNRDQIAEVMGINDQSVSNLLQMAIKQLKANWNGAVLGLFLAIIRFLIPSKPPFSRQPYTFINYLKNFYKN